MDRNEFISSIWDVADEEFIEEVLDIDLTEVEDCSREQIQKLIEKKMKPFSNKDIEKFALRYF